MSPRRPSAQRIEFSAVKTDRYWKAPDSILIVVKVKVRISSKDNLVLTTVKGIMTDPAKVLAAAPISSNWPALGFPLKTEWRIQCIEEK